QDFNSPVSGEMLLRCGPCHCGQSAACAVARAQPNTISPAAEYLMGCPLTRCPCPAFSPPARRAAGGVAAAHVVAEDEVLVAEVEPAVGDDRVRPDLPPPVP